MTTPQESQVCVIGAGVIGITAALALQQRGLSVTVLDPQGPGEGTSSGNAGYIAVELINPLATPHTLRQAPSLWLDPHGPLALPLRYLPAVAPWLARFIAAASPRRVEESRRAIHALNSEAVTAWQRCLAKADASDALVQSGYLMVWESPRGMAAARQHMAQLEQWGQQVVWLEGADLQRHEPGLQDGLSHGLYLPKAHQVRDPYALVQRLAGVLTQRGSSIVKTTVEAVHPQDTGVTLETDDGPYHADHAVIAAGAWSHRLAGQLGLSIPLETERGYHLTLPSRVQALKQPVGSAERHCVMTPMSCGLRIVSFTELGGLTLPPIMRRYRSLRHHAKALLQDSSGIETAQEWMGFRPTLPDSLPVIDTHPEHPCVHFAFGHQHLGLTQAAITAELLSALVFGEAPHIDLKPYRASRF
ncbi:NAD(P)/FAD-dependent oxidoreductase [Halomonas alimentaria]|uniref:FAD-dependent oxidoreductase n=1 Tax=Halomonas alimentaria TaxID=147248 RepID=A0A7X5APV5_9GAMM|nr:FAD-binding oxidoreductase [Halomonas alimentaria]NAW34353.1 FAD-dependent oxidoreductase [Halomonas alimentaria]